MSDVEMSDAAPYDADSRTPTLHLVPSTNISPQSSRSASVAPEEEDVNSEDSEQDEEDDEEDEEDEDEDEDDTNKDNNNISISSRAASPDDGADTSDVVNGASIPVLIVDDDVERQGWDFLRKRPSSRLTRPSHVIHF